MVRIDFQAIRVLIVLGFQYRQDQFVIALASRMNRAILESENRKRCGFFDRFGKYGIRLELAVVGGG